MKRNAYIKKLKNELFKYIKEREEDDMGGVDDETWSACKEDTAKASSIGELFVVMSDMAFDVPTAVGFAMRIVLPDCSEFEFTDVPMRNWDT